jgi:hypothetical protein
MAKDVLHVVPHEDTWAVRREGNERVSSTHPTQKDAIEAARDLAKERDDIVIHRADGTIRERVTYTGSNGEARPATGERRAEGEPGVEDVVGVRSRVSWAAVMAGAAVALAAFFTLTLLALAIGASVGDRVSDRTAGVAAAVISAAILFASLFYGGYVASRTTAGERPMEGVLYGVLVWGAALFLLALGARAGLSFANEALLTAGTATANVSATPNADRVKQRLNLNDQQVQEYTALVNESRPTVEVNAREAAWWTFAGVALSLVASMLGGWFGTGAQVVLRDTADERRAVAIEPRPA